MKTLLLLGLLLKVSGCGCEVGEGSATGYVTSVEESGLIWTTPALSWKSDTESSHTNKLCVRKNKEKLLTELRQFGKTRERVEIIYSRLFLVDWLWNCNLDESVIVTSVKVISDRR